MTTIATFPDVMSASIAQGMLESNGIKAVIENQAMSSIYPAPLSGSSEVTLAVSDTDADRTTELLNEHGDESVK